MNKTAVSLMIYLITGGLLVPALAGQEDPFLKYSAIKNPFIPQLPVTETVAREEQPDSLLDETEGQEAQLAIQETIQEKIPIEIPQITINGLVWNTDRPQAIVDDAVVEIGDRIKDFEIVAIHKDGIKVKYNEVFFTLRAEQEISATSEQNVAAPEDVFIDPNL